VEGIRCYIPEIIRGLWFSWENQNVLTEINAENMTSKGFCVDMKVDYRVNYTFVFQKQSCFYCVKILIRTVNVLDRMQTGCVNLPINTPPTVENVCSKLDESQQLITLFSDNPTPVNCRSSLEGVWQFAYQVQKNVTLECLIACVFVVPSSLILFISIPESIPLYWKL